MQLTITIPDDLAHRLNATSDDLSRRAFEAFALEEYRSSHISQAELRHLLGFPTREALDGFLKNHGVFLDYSLDDLEQERRDLDHLGI